MLKAIDYCDKWNELKMDAEGKEFLSRAAALMGTTMAAFVRTAAKENARELLGREARDDFFTTSHSCRVNLLRSPISPL